MPLSWCGRFYLSCSKVNDIDADSLFLSLLLYYLPLPYLLLFSRFLHLPPLFYLTTSWALLVVSPPAAASFPFIVMGACLFLDFTSLIGLVILYLCRLKLYLFPSYLQQRPLSPCHPNGLSSALLILLALSSSPASDARDLFPFSFLILFHCLFYSSRSSQRSY